MRRRKRALSFLLVGILVLGSVTPVYADSIKDKKQKAKELEAEKEAAEKERQELSDELDKIITDMKQTQSDLEKKQDEIVETADDLDKARVEENDQYEAMKLRIKYMYENGNTEFIEIICSASSIADMLNKAEYVTKISECDRELLEEFQALVEQIEEKEAQLKEEEEELKEIQNKLKDQQAQVQELLEGKNIEIGDLQAEIGKNAAELAQLLKEAEAAAKRQAEAEAAAKAAAAASSSSSSSSAGADVVSGSGQLSNPCPAARISSGFGPRSAPVAGASTYHRGLDFAAPSGTPVYAADGGTVTTVGYNSARGNYIIVNHGNGLQTLYQHLSASYVSAGTSVSRGQNIGAVGSTGISSGAHLHFEVHVNGTPVNPANYL